ncbi:toxin VasX [Pseudomonas sp. DSP3-2-2]|uniref:toxin VasX n=1 Tax=unclassified Pseudomonas TaxID=196821 RepID=UPI003CE6D088
MTNPCMTPRGHMANLVACARRAESPEVGGVCPLMMQTLQLLPVRYGMVEDLDPSGELSMPYKLQSRPLGFRLLRDGFLYIIDSATGLLHEYQTKDGSVVALLFKGSNVATDRRTTVVEVDPALVFSRASVLHVTYSEVQWTAFKCAQVVKVAAEREYFMQRISFEGVDYGKGQDLVDDTIMAAWLAEACLRRAGKPGYPSELAAYPWEHPPQYRKTIIEELTSQITAAHKHDFLFLAVRDDVGVMRDLANHQNHVVGQIQAWANEGDVERDYLLGCYIESITLIDEDQLNERAKRDWTLQALLGDLQSLPEPERSQTRKTLREVMGEDNSQNIPRIEDPDLPADLRARLDKIPPDTDRQNIYAGQSARLYTLQQYYLEQRFTDTSPEFIAGHRSPLWKLYRQMDKPTKELLYGAKFGQRGINELIDRPAMDAFLQRQREVLQPLNDLLEKITQDRVDLLIKDRLHRALWYYDIEDSAQVDHALLTEYDCLKDICRSDSAIQQTLDWLNANPAMTRQMFYAAPRSAQTELGVQFVSFTNAGWLLIKDAPEWTERLRQWGAGLVLNSENLSPATQINAAAALGTLAPALQMGMQQAVQDFMQNLDKGQMPDIEDLFRRMPKGAGVALLDAARREGVTFVVGNAEDARHASNTLQEVLGLRRQLTSTKSIAKQRKAQDKFWHLTPQAQSFKDREHVLKLNLQGPEAQLARLISPIGALPEDATHLQAASSGKPGLTLVFPSQQHAEVRSLLDTYRHGVTVAPKAGLLGDGAGLLVFVAQVVNFLQVRRVVFSQPEHARDIGPFLSASAATVAAGFGAAQGIADTALNAHATELGKNLKKAELMGVHVQMGKLHISLGMVGYAAGMVSASLSLTSSYNNWQDAVRKGNREAQAGAALSMLGNSGFIANNAYGLANTVQAFRHVLAAEAGSAARTAAWAVAGVRLSTVFLRFNVVGILFTALELSGTWLYNRYNLSFHDRWLLSTPWGMDPDHRKSLPLYEYQKALRGHIQAPHMQILPATDDSGVAEPQRFLLHFPTLSAADLTKQLASSTSSVLLNIGGYQVIREIPGRMGMPAQWSRLDESLEERVQLKQQSPLILEFTDLRGLLRSDYLGHTDIVLSIQLGHTFKDGTYEANLYDLNFPVIGESGNFPVRTISRQGEECRYFRIDPALMPELDNSDDN